MFGIDDFIGGAVSAVGNYFTSAKNNEASMDRQLQAQGFNSAEADKSRSFSAGQQQIAQDYNASEAAKGRDFNAEEAVKNRDWQQMMSSTAYQRSMDDMRKAGLNPILAYSQGGASTPGGGAASSGAASVGAASGSTASSPTPAVPENAFKNAFSSALEYMRTSPMIENLKETNKNLQEENRRIFTEANKNNAISQLYHEQRDSVKADIDIKKENLKTAEKQASVSDADKELYDSKPGRILRQIGTGMRELNPFVSNAKSMNSMINGGN